MNMNGSHNALGCKNRSAIRHVYLSGGGYRAALGSAGAIAYLLVGRQPGESRSRWAHVEKVISVSGGSLLNGALARSAATTDEEFGHELGAFVRRMATDGVRLWKSWRRIAVTLLLVACVVLSSWILLGMVGVVAPLVQNPRVAALLGVLVLPLPIAAFRLLLHVCLLDVIRSWVRPHACPAEQSTRRFVFATAGLETGEARFLTFGDGEPEIELHHAVRASASLPGVGWLSAARTIGKEDLADGGVLGFFGSSYRNDLGDRCESSLFVDARSGSLSSSGIVRLARRMSLAANLGCWLRISLEANYRLQRDEISTGRIVRLTAHAAGDVRPAHTDSLFAQQLAELRRRVGSVGLYGFTSGQAAMIVASGVINCAHELDGLDSSEDAVELLERTEQRLGLGLDLVHAWRSTARGLALHAPSTVAMTHGGLADGSVRKHSPEAHHLAVRTRSFAAHHVDTVRRTDGALVSGHSMFTVKPQRGSTSDLQMLFDELLDRHRGNDVLHINLEVKRRHTHRGLRELLHGLEQSGQLHHISVSSPFHTGFLRRLRSEFPTLATNESLVEGALLGVPVGLRRRSRRTEASGVQLHYWIARSAALRRAATSRAGHVEVWGVNNVARATRMVAVGVDVIITDEVDVAKFICAADQSGLVQVASAPALGCRRSPDRSQSVNSSAVGW